MLEQCLADLFPLSPLQAVAGPLTERHARFVMVLDLAPGQWIDTVHSGVRRGSLCSTWIRARARLMADRKLAPTMAILAAPAITHCSCSNKLGDLDRCALRPGNAHSATGWREVLEPVVAR
jgi:hypothetical protein